MNTTVERLLEPFPAEDIEWRVDRVMKSAKGQFVVVLAYVTNRAIMNRLDEIFGPFGWKNEFKPWRDRGTLCTISAKMDDEWVSKCDGADETQFEATKGGFSGAMKRAAVQWGIGRYLYNLDQVIVEVKDKGKNYVKAKPNKNKDEYVTGYWDTPKLPAWALPKQQPPTTDEKAGSNPPPPEEETTQGYTCIDGGESITKAVYNYSMRHYKKPLCQECQKKHTKVAS